MKKKLAIITTHPIQYYAPLFRELAKSEKIDLKVFYTKGEPKDQQFEPDFGKSIAWDIPLLDGYSYAFLKNSSKKESGFWSITNPDLISEIKNWGAEAVLVFGWSYQSHLKVMRYFKGKVPVFFRGDSTLLDEKPGYKSTIRRVFLRWVYSYIDKAFYVGEANKNYYLKHGLMANQLIFAPHAIDNERFVDQNHEYATLAEKWKKELGIKENEKVILFVGKFIAKKNPLILLEAFKRFNTANTHLIFVGNGDLEAHLKKASQNHANIHFIPFQNQSQMPIVYRLGDIFCLPSQGPGETWGLAVNEAMASGCAILVSDKCGCATDLVRNGENGFVFKSNNATELKEKLQKMLELDLKNLKQKSIEIISEYTFRKIVDEIQILISPL